MKVLVAAAVWTAALVCARAGSCDAAARYSQEHGENSLLVWEKGRTLYERGPADPSRPMRIFSVTKSLVAIGVMRDRDNLSLRQAVLFPGARGVPLADLLNQVSGLPSASEEFYSDGLRDKRPVLAKLRRERSGFVYGASHWEVLGEEIARAVGDIGTWLQRFVPGVGPRALALWRRDKQGRFFFSTGARMGARDLLPAARAVLDGAGTHGKWTPEARALLANGTGSNPMYALGFWLNRSARPGAREVDVEGSISRDHPASFWRGGCLSTSAPPDLLAMIGTRGQRVYIVPSRQLVIVRLGSGSGFSDAEFLRNFFAAN